MAEKTKQIKLKIVLIINTLVCGGAERVLVHLSKAFVESGHDVTVVVFTLDNQYFALDSRVKVINLRRKSSFDVFSTCLRLRHTIRECQPDAVVTFMTNVTYHLLAALFLFRPYPNIYATFHIHHSTSNKGFYRFLNLCIFNRMMSRCAKLICCSRDMANDLCNLYSLERKNVTTIYNPIDLNLCKSLATEQCYHPFFENQNTPVLLAVGSLCEQKNYSMMLEAIARVCKEKPVKLIVLGEGYLRPNLEELCDELGLADVVDFIGNVKNPFAYMALANLFVLSSHFEGFPMVLLETMACGLPIVSVDCPSGPRELIENGRTGILVPPGSSTLLSEGLCRALDEPKVMQKYAENAFEYVSKNFLLEHIASEYLKVITKSECT